MSVVEAKKAIVVGGGIVGMCCALALQRQGHKVLVIDPARSLPAASWGNAGHIAIEQVEPLASPAMLRSALRRLMFFGGPLSLPPGQIASWLPFALRLARAARPDRFGRGKMALGALMVQAMPAWQRLSASLEPRGLLIESGHAVVWHDAHAAQRGLKAWQGADTGSARFHTASKQELAWLAGAMKSPPAGAILFENTGQVTDPGGILTALDHAFRAAGGERRAGLVHAITVKGGMAELVLDGGEQLSGPHVVLAAGVESGALIAPLGLKAPIIAERGYHIHTQAHQWPKGMPPVVFEEYSMIVTGFESGLRVAGFVEFGRRDAAADLRKWHKLERHAEALGLPAIGPWHHWAGARPTLPDYLPAIGRAQWARNLVYAFGHQHLGLTLAPITGEIVAAMVQEREPLVPVAPFDLERFGSYA